MNITSAYVVYISYIKFFVIKFENCLILDAIFWISMRKVNNITFLYLTILYLAKKKLYLTNSLYL